MATMLTRASLRIYSTWVLVGLSTIVVAPIVGEWFVRVAEDKGLYENAGSNWDAAVHEVINFVVSPWALFPLAIFSGFVVGIWADYFLKRLESRNNAIKPGPTSFASQVYTRVDLERRQAVLNDLFDALNGPIREACKLTSDINENLEANINSHSFIAVKKELEAFFSQLITANKNLSDAVHASDLYPEIRNMDWSFSPIFETTNVLIEAVGRLGGNGSVVVFDSNIIKNWQAAVAGYADWIQRTKVAIVDKKQEYENASKC